ncbi:hypothetical protein LZ31DRAFT_482931 [Colletotrichum somersetense]|nr:hypothetical protein LZ31DRAFT_482931 [Colletotrichum somersetense]
MSRSTRLILISICFVLLFTRQSEGVTCYSYSGLAWPDQQVCPGSNACCGVKDRCMPNRMCKSPDIRDNILVRGPCLSSPWDRKDCAQICVFNETNFNTGFNDYVFPRVEICDKNTYCCRQGSDSCCDSSLGKVYLDDNGVLLSAAPSQTTVSSVASSMDTTSTAASSSETIFATTTSASAQDPTSASSTSASAAITGSKSGTNEALALKVGLGVGIPFAATVVGLATWLLCRKRRNKNGNASEQSASTLYYTGEGHEGYAKGSTYRSSPYTSYRSPNPAGLNEMHEMPARPDERWDGTPRELLGSEVRDGQNR